MQRQLGNLYLDVRSTCQPPLSVGGAGNREFHRAAANAERMHLTPGRTLLTGVHAGGMV
jgi:hypothetical protein